MIQSDIDSSSDENSITEIIISDDEEDLEDLRQMALLSMVKTETSLSEENLISIITVEDIEKQLKECREGLQKKDDITNIEIDTTSNCVNSAKRHLSDDCDIDYKRHKLSADKVIVEEMVGKPMKINNNSNDNFTTQSQLKERLYQIFNSRSACENINDNDSKLVTNYKCSNVFTNIEQKIKVRKDIYDEGDVMKRYVSYINNNEKSVDEISKSIENLTTAIQEKLQKSKAISAQIENLKRHKTELHKDINVTRSKILDLNKVKKQRIIKGAQYKALRKKYELSPISSANADKTDTLSTIINENEDFGPTIDCNQIVCSSWIHGNCSNKHCVYQHPKIFVKPITKSKLPIKENDKVFLPEMNPLGFISVFYCEACSSRVLLSNLHIVDDWHCKSCCQQILMCQNPTDVLKQLINIWHHFYKRYMLTQNISVQNRDVTVIDSLYKCTDALQAKITNSSDIQEDLLQMAGRHILFVYNESNRVDDALNFLKIMNYNNNLVLFATKLSFPVPSIHTLITDVIVYQINKTSFTNVGMLIRIYCQLSEHVKSKGLTSQLFQWLEMAIRMNVAKNCGDVISALTKALLTEVIGSPSAHSLTYSFFDFHNDEQFWLDRKDIIADTVRLYAYDGQTTSNMYLVLNKYLILSLFYTDNEEGAIELCQQFSRDNFYFKILFSKLSLKYNYPIATEDSGNVAFVEHSYNKAEWLLLNRSEKSCVKILEGVIGKICIVHDQNEALYHYEHFLGLQRSTDSIKSNFTLKIPDFDAKLILETSSIWMCYFTLMFLKEDLQILSTLLTNDTLFVLSKSHLCRVIQLIFNQFPKLYDGETYSHKVKSTLLRIQKYLDFPHFMDLFTCICFKKFGNCQLSMWLFLIDFCGRYFTEESRSIFLTEMSWNLLANESSATNYDIFSHIVLCYPISIEKVWLNLIELIIKLCLPLYTLIDACGTAVSFVRSSKSLWRYYYNTAIKVDDESLISNVKENAAKMGFRVD